MNISKDIKRFTFWIMISVIPLILVVAVIFFGAMTNTPILPNLNKDISNAIFVFCFALPFAVAIIGAFLVFKKPFMSFFGGGRETKRILSTGRPATAMVVQISESSVGGTMTINDQPYLNLQLEVRDGNTPPYTVSLDTIIPRSAVPQFQPGALIPVKVDLNDPMNIAINWSADMNAGQQGAPPAAAPGSQPVGNVDEWTQSDNSLLEEQGIDGSAKLLSIEDTGKSENFNPVVKISYEIRARDIDTYTFSKEVPLPTQTINLLKGVIRKSFPARIHPHDRTKIKVNVTF